MATYFSMNNVTPGTKLRLIREKRSSWGWVLSEGEIVEILELQYQPTRFKVKDSQSRTWILDTHDAEIVDEEITSESPASGSA